MKKWTFFILLISLFLCSCGQKQPDQHLQLPGTSWGMNVEEVQDALDIQKEDLGYVILGRLSSMLHMEDYELFGAKAETIDLNFLNLEAYQDEDLDRKILDGEWEGQELFDQRLSEIDGRILELTRDHKLTMIIVDYPDNTDMEQVLEEMKKKYGDTISDMTAYELQTGSFAPKEYKDSEQVKIWGTDVIGSLIPENESTAYRDGFKHYNQKIDEAEWAAWEPFMQNARMEWILWINEKDSKRLMFTGLYGSIYQLLQEQISSQNK